MASTVDNTLTAGSTTAATATCPGTTTLLGGGWRFSTSGVATGDFAKLTPMQSYPSAANAYTAQVFVNSGAGGSITVFSYAICTTT